MRKLIAVAVMCASLGLILGIALHGASRSALAGGIVESCTAKNGDVNGDGNTDLSDAVTILGNLFLGSPTELLGLCEPAQLAACRADLASTRGELAAAQASLANCRAALAQCQAGNASALPDTGQSACWGLVDNQEVEVPCSQTECGGQDGSYATGCYSEGRFTDNDDGTVTDHCTGLMWQKDTADLNGDGLTADEVRNWALAQCYCESLSFAGHDDWRLPNVRELQSIIDYGRVGPAIDPVFSAFSGPYWSSTTHAGDPRIAWLVGFGDGQACGFLNSKAYDYYVRAVRNAQ